MGRLGPTIASFLLVVMAFGIYAMYTWRGPASALVTTQTRTTVVRPGMREKAVIPGALDAPSPQNGGRPTERADAKKSTNSGSKQNGAPRQGSAKKGGSKAKGGHSAPSGGQLASKQGGAGRGGSKTNGGNSAPSGGEPDVAPPAEADKLTWLPKDNIDKIKELYVNEGMSAFRDRLLSKMDETHRNRILALINSTDWPSAGGENSGTKLPQTKVKPAKAKSGSAQAGQGQKDDADVASSDSSASESGASESSDSASYSGSDDAAASFSLSFSESSGSDDYFESPAASSDEPSLPPAEQAAKRKLNEGRGSASGRGQSKVSPKKPLRPNADRKQSRANVWSDNKPQKTKPWSNTPKNAGRGGKGDREKKVNRGGNDGLVRSWRLGGGK